MTTIFKTVRCMTQDAYACGRNAPELVVSFEKGDLITIREQGWRTKHTARLYDVLG